jgi:hypothetical protein
MANDKMTAAPKWKSGPQRARLTGDLGVAGVTSLFMNAHFTLRFRVARIIYTLFPWLS